MTNSLQEWLDETIAAARAAQFASRDQLSLGQLIDELKSVREANGNKDVSVCFDFEHAYPTNFDSWRGVYAELALGFSFEGVEPTLDEMIDRAEDAVGRTYEGYKGGDYTMTRETPVWVANFGNAGSTAVTGVYNEGWQVVLLTGYRR